MILDIQLIYKIYTKYIHLYLKNSIYIYNMIVNYECMRCGNKRHIKTIMIRHLNRKRLCKLKKYNINIQKFKQDLLDGKEMDSLRLEIENTQNESKMNPNESKISQNESKMNPNKSKIYKKIYKCSYCEKNYSSNSNLNKHLKSCREKKKSDDAKKSMDELVNILNQQLKEVRKELENKNKQIDELIKKAGIQNSTITQNIQNNIKLLAYKDTDISNISDKDILKCLNHSNMCVPHLIKMIHLNPDLPENHNIYISNLKNGYIMIYDGDKWTTLNREDVIDNLINDKQCLIEERIENWIENGQRYPIIMKKFERYLEKKENNVVLDKIKQEIRLMLFNNRNMVKNKLIEI